jgi:MerR family transcriptional regulator, light-induced transcriptional regulator
MPEWKPFMISPESLLKTNQVAGALGVSVSTIKRWVDSGALLATRTVGKHRLVPVCEAIRFACAQNLPHAELQALLGGSGWRSTTVDGSAVDALTEALRRGHTAEARGRIVGAYAGLRDASRLADDLIRPAMEQVGHAWEAGTLDVFQEHQASRVVEAALTDLIGRVTPFDPAPGTPLALGASPEGDLYTLSNLSCELALREMGWEVVNLGPNLPLPSLAKAVRVYRPALAWLSIHHLADSERFAREYAAFHAAASETGTAVCLGGSALSPSLRTRLLAASFGERVAHLAEFARRLRPANSPQPIKIDDSH